MYIRREERDREMWRRGMNISVNMDCSLLLFFFCVIPGGCESTMSNCTQDVFSPSVHNMAHFPHPHCKQKCGLTVKTAQP
jgi:hypothetical protein